MRLLIQRVKESGVVVDGQQVAKIGTGLLVFVGFGQQDTQADFPKAIKKVLELRIFPDESGRFHFSAQDVAAEILLVSQFTLYANTNKGRRPDFFSALAPQAAEGLYEQFCQAFKEQLGHRVQSGIFGAMMEVHLINDGPVTIFLTEEDLKN
jgi:D-tyrosyl-tRNA(Tyr) deacylase